MKYALWRNIKENQSKAYSALVIKKHTSAPNPVSYPHQSLFVQRVSSVEHQMRPKYTEVCNSWF